MLAARVSAIWTKTAPWLESGVKVLRGEVLIALFVGWSLGYVAWALTHQERLGAALANDLSHKERLVALGYVAATTGVSVLAWGAWRIFRQVLRLRAIPKPTVVLCPALALPFAVTLLTPDIERSFPATTLCLSLVVATLGMVWLSALLGLPSLARAGAALSVSGAARVSGLRRALERAPAVLVALLWLSYTIYMSQKSLLVVDALGSRNWDLSIYNNILYHTAQGNYLGASLVRGGTHTTAHFDPILIALSFPYRLYPDKTFLLVLQSLWCGFGVVPSYLLGKHYLSSGWAGLGVAVAYALHPALQGANTNSFHSLTLVASSVLLAWYFLEIGAYRRYFLLLPVIFSVREDTPLLCVFIGLALLFAKNDAKRLGVGLLTVVLSLGYFVGVKRYFMATPDVFMKGKDTYDYASAFRFMIPNNLGMKDYALSLVTNPVAVLRHAFDAPKLTYLLKMLGPFLFLPLFAPRGRFALGYGFLFLLLASKRSMFGTIGQYSLVALPILAGLLPAGLEVASRWRVFGDRSNPKRAITVLLAGVLTCSYLVSCKFGAMAPNATLTTIPERYTKEARLRRAFIQTLLPLMPKEASVVASNKLLPFVSNRLEAYVYEDKRLRPPEPPDFYFVTTVGVEASKIEKYLGRVRAHRRYEVVASAHDVTLYRKQARAAPPPREASKPATPSKRETLEDPAASSKPPEPETENEGPEPEPDESAEDVHE